MQKTTSKIVTIVLLAAMTLAIFPLSAYASTGYALINPAIVPPNTVLTSTVTSVPAGGNINLYLGGVTFSGGQAYLLLSTDGFSQVSTSDMRYTPTISVAAVQSATVTTISNDATFPGTWTIGQGWVNGSIPQNIAGGEYFIKVFDGAVTFLAVTDIPFTVTAAFTVKPTSGPGGTTATLNGYAFPPNALVNTTYLNPITSKWITIQNLTQCNALGQFSFTVTVADLQQGTAAPGDQPVQSNDILFVATENKTNTNYEAIFTEYQRGLLQFGRPKATGVTGSLQNATGLFGNNTDFSSAVKVGVGDSVRIVGKYFYPGTIAMAWDNVEVTPAGGVTANATGIFNATITVPVSGVGMHNITIADSNGVKFVMFLEVIPSISLNPKSGPVGTTVTVNGYGFPANGNPAGTAYNVTISGFDSAKLASGFTDSSGSFIITFVVPQAVGGQNTITATANNTAATSATATFTVTALFTVSPDSFANNGTLLVKAAGSGFKPGSLYSPNIDNSMIGMNQLGGTWQTNLQPNATGYLTFTFMGAWFQPGVHTVTIYENNTVVPAASAYFTVLNDGDPTIAAILSTNSSIHAKLVTISGDIVTIKSGVTTLQTTLTALDAKIVALDGKVVTLQTNIGTVQTSISSLPSSISSTIQTSVSNGMATIQTSIGTINTKLTSLDAVLGAVAGDVVTLKTSIGDVTTTLDQIGTVVSDIQGDVITIQTDFGTLQGVVTQIKDGVAQVQTGIGTIQVDVSNLQPEVQAASDNTSSMSTMIYVAVAFAIIAAIAAVASILLMRKKIAS